MLCRASEMRLSASAAAGAWSSLSFSSASPRRLAARCSADLSVSFAVVWARCSTSATMLSAWTLAASPASVMIFSARARASSSASATILAGRSLASCCAAAAILSTCAAASCSAAAMIRRASSSEADILYKTPLSASAMILSASVLP